MPIPPYPKCRESDSVQKQLRQEASSTDQWMNSHQRVQAVNSEGRPLAQPGPLVQNDPASERKLPDNWTEVIKDPTLWAELRDIILGSNEDED
jgi:hypothetical protein